MNGLPTGWTWTDTATVAEVQGGIQKQPKRKPIRNHYPFLRVANVARGRLELSDVHRIELFKGEIEKYRLRDGDLLVVEGNGSPDQIGRAARWLGGIEDCVHQNHLIRVRPTAAVNSKYLGYYWNAPQTTQYLRSIASSTSGLYVLTAAKVRGVRIPLPPIDEQERIAAAIEEQFSRLDTAVVALERVRQNLKRMRSAAFTLITGSVDAWRTLGEIAEVVGGVTKDAKRQSDPSFVEVPYLRVANVQRGYLDLTTVTPIRVPAPTVDKLRLDPGDILFNEGGDRDKLGRGWVWEGQIKDCIHQNHVFRARLRTEEFEPKFISMHGNTFGRTWFEKMGKQTTNLASLNLRTLKSFPVPDLPVERQREIIAEVERQLSLLDSLQSVADHSLMHGSLLRSSILAAAFSGQLVPQDPNEEPAAVLLERVATDRIGSNGHKPRRTRGPRASREAITI